MGKKKEEKKTPQKKIQVEVSNEIHKAVKVKALTQDTTVSEVVRKLLLSWLKEKPEAGGEGEWEEESEGKDKW